MSVPDLVAARTAVARAVRSGDADAEARARGALVAARIRAEVDAARAKGVTVSAAQWAELVGLLDAVAPDRGPTICVDFEAKEAQGQRVG